MKATLKWPALPQKRPAAKPAGPPAPALTTQQWLPVRDIRDGCLFRPDGGVVAGVQLRMPALALKSAAEQDLLIAGWQAALDGLGCPWQILTLPRPIDLDQYLAGLDAAVQATPSGPRRRVLGEYLRWVSGLARQGEATERRSYLLLSRTGPDAVAEHRQTLAGLLDDLARLRGVEATPLDDAGWRSLLFLAFHAGRAAVEPAPDTHRAIPLYRPAPTQGGE